MKLFRPLTLALMLAAAPLAAQDQLTGLVVTGTGEATAAPDMAVVTLGAEAEAATARAAMGDVSATLTAMTERLEAAGVEARDIQTSGLRLNPVYDHSKDGPPELRGYSAGNMVTVRVRDLAKLGALLDGLLDDGANNLNGLTFTVEDSASLTRDAKRAAVADARATAELLAEAAGVTLGPIQRIETSASGRPMPYAGAEMAMVRTAADAMPVSEGEVAQRASVTLTYAIAPAE